jgi:hypothetical protein
MSQEEELRLDWFWNLISAAQRNRSELERILRGLSREDLVHFDHCFYILATDLEGPTYTRHLPDLSEDGVKDIAEWVVTQGREYYEAVLADPTRMPASFPGGVLASFSGVADNVFYERFREVIPPPD